MRSGAWRLGQHRRGHAFDAVVPRMHVGHADVEVGWQGRPLGLPEALVAGEAGQEDKSGHGAIVLHGLPCGRCGDNRCQP